MSAGLLREAAALMRERAEAATDGGHGWRIADLPGANEVWADRDAAGFDAFMVATTATRLNPNPGIAGYHDAVHIASWHPAVALAVANWLDDLHDAMTNPDAPNSGVHTTREEQAALNLARAYLGRAS